MGLIGFVTFFMLLVRRFNIIVLTRTLIESHFLTLRVK